MRWQHRLVVITLLLATPVAIWWMVGDLSTIDPSQVEPDYVIRPLGVSAEAERMIGISASLLVLVAAGGLATVTIRASVNPRWWFVVLPLLVAGAFCGLALRIGTAAVIGANIGWGLVVVAGPPFICAMLLTSKKQWEKTA